MKEPYKSVYKAVKLPLFNPPSLELLFCWSSFQSLEDVFLKLCEFDQAGDIEDDLDDRPLCKNRVSSQTGDYPKLSALRPIRNVDTSFKFQKCFIEHCIYNINITFLYGQRKFNG